MDTRNCCCFCVLFYPLHVGPFITIIVRHSSYVQSKPSTQLFTMGTPSQAGRQAYASLPMELWVKIIRYIQTKDVPEAWFTLRRVSASELSSRRSCNITFETRSPFTSRWLETRTMPRDALPLVCRPNIRIRFTHFSGPDDARAHFTHDPARDEILNSKGPRYRGHTATRVEVGR